MAERFQLALWADRDRRWALSVHRRIQGRVWTRVLMAASRLGDGILWYAVIALTALAGGVTGRDAAAQMVMLGAVNLTLYWCIKRSVARARPFVGCADIRACGRVLDAFSFPSGHTVHATAFTLLLADYFPWTAVLLVPLALLIALSRIALGLHYPSDVVAGFLLGAATSTGLLLLY